MLGTWVDGVLAVGRLVAGPGWRPRLQPLGRQHIGQGQVLQQLTARLGQRLLPGHHLILRVWQLCRPFDGRVLGADVDLLAPTVLAPGDHQARHGIICSMTVSVVAGINASAIAGATGGSQALSCLCRATLCCFSPLGLPRCQRQLHLGEGPQGLRLA